MYKWVLATNSSGDITLTIFLGASCYMYLNIVLIIIIIIIISFVIIIISIYNNFYYYYYFFKSLFPLVVTLCDLSDANTTLLICYEERTTGNKPLLEKKFHQVQIFSSLIEFSFCMIWRIMQIKKTVIHKGKEEVQLMDGLLPMQPCFPSRRQNNLLAPWVPNSDQHQFSPNHTHTLSRD